MLKCERVKQHTWSCAQHSTHALCVCVYAGDCRWPASTPFSTALCGFCPAPFVSLRTLKADVIAGVYVCICVHVHVHASFLTGCVRVVGGHRLRACQQQSRSTMQATCGPLLLPVLKTHIRLFTTLLSPVFFAVLHIHSPCMLKTLVMLQPCYAKPLLQVLRMERQSSWISWTPSGRSMGSLAWCSLHSQLNQQYCCCCNADTNSSLRHRGRRGGRVVDTEAGFVQENALRFWLHQQMQHRRSSTVVCSVQMIARLAPTTNCNCCHWQDAASSEPDGHRGITEHKTRDIKLLQSRS